MESHEKLTAEIVEAWQSETGLPGPYPGTILSWIALADCEKTIFSAIAKVGRKAAAAARHNNAMSVGQAVRYVSNVLRNDPQARAAAAAQ